MRTHRIHVPEARVDGERAELDAAGAGYLARVLRLSPGDRVEVFDGDGGLYDATIRSLDGDGGVLSLGPRREAGRLPRPFVLLQGLAKGEKMELVIQKATELGVTRVVPVACARSVVRLDPARAEKKVARWRKIAAEAARQCGRADVPEVEGPAPLPDAVAALAARDDLARMVAWEEATEPGLGGFLDAESHRPGHALLVGPEGGLAAEEIRAAEDAGFTAVTLGRRILRTETVALAVLAAVRFVQGALG